MIFELPHARKGSGTSNQFMRELALMVGLVILDLVVALLGVVC